MTGENAENPPTQVWYRRIDVWTLVFLVLGGTLHYWLVDRPATAALLVNRQLTERNIQASEASRTLIEADISQRRAHTEFLRQDTQQSRANTLFLNKNVERLESPTTKSAEALAVMKQQIDEARLVDGLIDSMNPNVQIEQDVPFDKKGNAIALTFRLKNIGARTTIVTAPEVRLARAPAPSERDIERNLSEKTDYTISGCQPGHIRPGQTALCTINIVFRPDLVLGDMLYMHTAFRMSGQLDRDSKSYKIVGSYYDDAALQQKLSFSISFNTELRMK